MLQIISLFLLFILPFLVNPFGGAFFEVPKVILAEVAIEMGTVYFLLRHRLRFDRTLFLAVAILFVLSLIDLIFHNSPTAFFGNQFRLQGTMLFWNLLIWSLISSRFDVKIPKLLPLFVLICLFLTTFIFGSNNNARAVGPLGEPNALAATVIFFWPFVWFGSSLFSKKSSLGNWFFKALILVLAILILFFSGSRSGLAAFIIEILFLVLWRITTKLKLALFFALIVLIMTLTFPFAEQQTHYRFEDRSEVWRVALNAGLSSPFLGHGFGNVEQAVKSTSHNLNSDLQYQYVDSAHNLFLDYWIEAGILGVGTLTALIIISLKQFIQFKKPLELTLLLGLLIVLSFNPASVVSLVAFWWIIGRSFLVQQGPIVDK